MGDLNNPNENNNEQQPIDQSADQSQNQQPVNELPLYQQPQNEQPQYQQPESTQNQYQQTYQQYQEPVQAKNNGMAIGSMICGIISLLLSCCFWYVALPVAIAGIVLGILVIKNKKGGKGMAIAGLVLSGITVIIAILALIACVAFTGNESFMEEFYKGFNEGLESSNY